MAFQDELNEAFPASSDANVIRAVSEGIFLAERTLENETFLKSVVGQDVRGYIRRAGILYRVNELAMVGDLPFQSTISQMPRGNWHWVELRSKRFTSHICRTDGPELFPVDTPTRQDERLTNEPDLFQDNPEVVPINGYFAWLTFGISNIGKLAHLCWAMPNAKRDEWLARTNIIDRAAQSAVVLRPEAQPATTGLKFRDHVEEALRGSGEDKGKKPA